jgi:hypothetical protein
MKRNTQRPALGQDGRNKANTFYASLVSFIKLLEGSPANQLEVTIGHYNNMLTQMLGLDRADKLQSGYDSPLCVTLIRMGKSTCYLMRDSTIANVANNADETLRYMHLFTPLSVFNEYMKIHREDGIRIQVNRTFDPERMLPYSIKFILLENKSVDRPRRSNKFPDDDDTPRRQRNRRYSDREKRQPQEHGEVGEISLAELSIEVEEHANDNLLEPLTN